VKNKLKQRHDEQMKRSDEQSQSSQNQSGR